MISRVSRYSAAGADPVELERYARTILPLDVGSLQGLNGAYVMYDPETEEVLAVSVWEDEDAFDAAGLAIHVMHEEGAELGVTHIETRGYTILNGMGLGL